MSRYGTTRVHGKSTKIHRVIWEQAHGMKIPDGCVIHHVDGNGNNNDLSNLQLMTKSEHSLLHARLRREGRDVVDPNDKDVQRTRARSKKWNDSHREHARQYYQEHKDQILASAKRYQTRNADKIKVRRTKYYNENREEILAQHAAYRKAHIDEVLARDARYRATHREELRAYKLEHRDILIAQKRLWDAKRKGCPPEEIQRLEETVRIEKERYAERHKE